jgi:3D-(3,5/4)-trihydroxycyclohexane-1,2-dione acylhydrolase (decyclizing)
MTTRRLTVAQALVEFLSQQFVERDGERHRFFAGCFGIFGHGNLAGIGQALQQQTALTYHQARNEQAMVHTAIAFARHHRRLRAMACTSSIGPGATNMVTGAATATINRIPVLLLPGDVFASRRVDPVLQQLEHPLAGDISVNDTFREVSRYFDRIWRPEQLAPAMLEAVRVLTDPAETGAVTLALPQDVQAEAFDWPVELFEERTWRIPRTVDEPAVVEAYDLLRIRERPLIVAGGGVRYSAAEAQLRLLAEATGIPVAVTQAGKGALPDDHPQCVGAIGATGTSAANRLARDADLVIGIGTRYSDFTTASRTQFQNPAVRFININVASADAHKHGGVGVRGDAAAVLRALTSLLATGGDRSGFEAVLAGARNVLARADRVVDSIRGDENGSSGDAWTGWTVDDAYATEVEQLRSSWYEERERVIAVDSTRQLPAQAEVLGVVNAAARSAESSGRGATVVCAAGSMPGDLHKLWLTNDPLGYHVEYGYSCMGYEVAGGLGVAMADPERRTIVLVGDGSWLMMSSEIVTAVQEGVAFTVVLVDNHGFGSIGALSTSLGSDGYGTRYRYRSGQVVAGGDGGFSGATLPLDLAATARGMGAHVIECATVAELETALVTADEVTDRPVVVTIETDPSIGVPGYDSWWDVPVAEVSSMDSVQSARAAYEVASELERPLI